MANTKLYGRDRDNVWELFTDQLSGNRNSLICVVSSKVLSPAASTALNKSFAALGYGEEPCTFVALKANADEKSVFSIVEALDPIILVIADGNAIEVCQKAWRQQIPPHTQAKVFGRKARAFTDLDSWVDDEKNKQKVWGLLKSLA